ncbi:MAG TPA: pyrroloquinoline quinone precursor peptide PqqA [Nitrospira sp.]|nr:pyrroloquinoline quinone precursor peptide PqqA [Nitrospira sp.]
MMWEKPDFIEINMSAEIGGYQDDFEERAPSEPSAVKQPVQSASTDEA